jgi:hypothetical protein
MSDPVFHAARLQRERFRALAAEHKVVALCAGLIEVAAMQQAADHAAATARDVLCEWVAATARDQAGLTDPADAEAYLRRTGREALTAICSRLQEQINKGDA